MIKLLLLCVQTGRAVLFFVEDELYAGHHTELTYRLLRTEHELPMQVFILEGDPMRGQNGRLRVRVVSGNIFPILGNVKDAIKRDGTPEEASKFKEVQNEFWNKRYNDIVASLAEIVDFTVETEEEEIIVCNDPEIIARV